MKKLLITILLILSAINIYSQSKIDILNNQKKEIQRQIEENNQQIDLINKSKTNTVNEITLKLKSIQLQNNLLINIKNQIETISNNLNNTTQEIDSLNLLVERRKTELINIYKSYYKKLIKKNDILLLLLSSKNFNQAYTRLKMYKNLVSYFNIQIQKLQQNKNELEQKQSNYILYLKELKLKENEFQMTLEQLKKEKNELEKTRKQLERKKIDLQNEINNQKKRLVLLDNEIKRIIEENAKSIKIMNKENARKYNELSANFKENKGKFPPPAYNSSILNTFGESQHPILKNVKVKNNGVDFIMSNNYNVYAIHKGEVKKIFNVPYGGKAIIIRHGEYLSVYSNLSDINVKIGQNVSAGEKIGDVMRQPDNTFILHFEIWNEKEPENPLNWIKF